MNYPINENGRTIGNTSFADMIAQAQVVTDIDNSIAALTTSLSTLSASSLVETNRATASENSIQAFVVAETMRAGFAETGIRASVVVETARAKAAEVVLTIAVTALQGTSSAAAQEHLMTSWFFGMGCASFGSQYARNEQSLNINIRCYRVGSAVTLTLYAAQGYGMGGNSAMYCEFLPVAFRPANDTTLPIVVFGGSNLSPGYLLVAANGEIMFVTFMSWQGNSGLTYNTCVSYLV